MTQLKKPSPTAQNFVPTLNSMGFMTAVIEDPYTRAFLDFIPKVQGPILEIGAAYGVVSLQALELGAQVIANDLDPRHLEILESEVKEKDRNRLTLLPGAFPDEVAIEENSIEAALAVRVFHFFDGPTIQRSLQTLHRVLRKAGRVYIVSETPYLRNWGDFPRVYEERKARGDRWPGWVRTQDFETEGFAKDLPEMMHALDPDILKRSLGEAGFRILKCGFFARTNFPENIRLDGRESVGIIGERL